MTYQECCDLRDQNKKLIGTTVTYQGKLYKVNSIEVFPPAETKVYLTMRKKDVDPEVRFVNHPDIEPMLICTNADGKLAVLRLFDIIP